MSTESTANLLTAAYMALVEDRGNKYLADEDTTAHIQELATALTAQRPRMGFMLCGPCGNGKTTLIHALQNSINFIHSAKGMERCISTKDGMQIIDALNLATMARTNPEGLQRVADYPLLAIEDMGKEAAEVNSYGNMMNPVAEVIERRYDRQLFTAITTNLTPKMLSEKYGARVADRFREMMTVLIFKNESYRGK